MQKYGIALAMVAATPSSAAAAPPEGSRLTQLRQIRPVRPQPQGPGQGFGTGFAIEGKTLVIGAPKLTHHGPLYTGAAYVFEEPDGGWGTKMPLAAATLTASDEKAQTWPPGRRDAGLFQQADLLAARFG